MQSRLERLDRTSQDVVLNVSSWSRHHIYVSFTTLHTACWTDVSKLSGSRRCPVRCRFCYCM